jgi:hypothetical protein
MLNKLGDTTDTTKSGKIEIHFNDFNPKLRG